jgi:ribose transport system substrate-binding protein
MKRWVTAICLVLAVAGCGGGKKTASSGLTVAVIPKGTSHMFWQSIHAGANRAGKELGVEVIWRGPLRGRA